MIEWLADTLVMTGALLVLVLLVRKPVGRLFGAGAAYVLWLLPMIRLVLPPLALPRHLVPVPHVSLEPVVAGAATGDMMQIDPQAVMVAPIAGMPVVETANPGAFAQISWSGMLLTVWLGGAVAFLAWRTWNYFTMRRELLAESRQVATAQGVRIIESPAAAAPLAFGVFDKVVALPEGFLADTDSESSDFAIAHELEHHAGNDLLAIIAVQPLFALHWFNPLAWAAWRALRGDQEAACDARVVAGRPRETRARYGELIASYAAGSRLALAAPMAGPLIGEKPIIHRLKALARKDVTPARRVLGRSIFALAVAAVPATATVSYAAMHDDEAAEAFPVPPVPLAPEVPAAAAAPAASLPSEAPEAPEVPEVPEHPEGLGDTVSTVPQPPTPPAPPAPSAARARIAMQAAREDAARKAAEAYRLDAQTERMVAQALARAPKVEQTVTADGKLKTIRIVRTDETGKREVVQEMILDERCPADSHRREARAEANGSAAAVVICTGAPKVATTEVLKALKSARATIAADRNLHGDVRADILADLDEEIADAHREAREND